MPPVRRPCKLPTGHNRRLCASISSTARPFPACADPANPTRRSILHYLVTNIPADGTASQGTEVSAASWRSSGSQRQAALPLAQEHRRRPCVCR